MGEMADIEIAQMELGQSLCRHKKTGRKAVIDNINLMYGNHDEWEILGSAEDDGDDVKGQETSRHGSMTYTLHQKNVLAGKNVNQKHRHL